MKITLKQLRQTVQEAISFDVDYLDSIGSQEMADAKRAVGEDPAAQAAHLGIGVEDWYTIRQELDDHYEDRHMEDQMAFDDDPDLDDDGMLSVGELVKMTQNIADDIKENKMKITRKQLRQIINEELNKSLNETSAWVCSAPPEVCALLTDDEKAGLSAKNSNLELDYGHDKTYWMIIDTSKPSGEGYVADFEQGDDGKWKRM